MHVPITAFCPRCLATLRRRSDCNIRARSVISCSPCYHCLCPLLCGADDGELVATSPAVSPSTAHRIPPSPVQARSPLSNIPFARDLEKPLASVRQALTPPQQQSVDVANWSHSAPTSEIVAKLQHDLHDLEVTLLVRSPDLLPVLSNIQTLVTETTSRWRQSSQVALTSIHSFEDVVIQQDSELNAVKAENEALVRMHAIAVHVLLLLCVSTPVSVNVCLQKLELTVLKTLPPPDPMPSQLEYVPVCEVTRCRCATLGPWLCADVCDRAIFRNADGMELSMLQPADPSTTPEIHTLASGASDAAAAAPSTTVLIAVAGKCHCSGTGQLRARQQAVVKHSSQWHVRRWRRCCRANPLTVHMAQHQHAFVVCLFICSGRSVRAPSPIPLSQPFHEAGQGAPSAPVVTTDMFEPEVQAATTAGTEPLEITPDPVMPPVNPSDDSTVEPAAPTAAPEGVGPAVATPAPMFFDLTFKCRFFF